LRISLCTGGLASHFYVDVEALVFTATVFRWVAGTADIAFAGISLIRRNVVGAPAVGVLDYSEGECAETIAVICTFSV